MEITQKNLSGRRLDGFPVVSVLLLSRPRLADPGLWRTSVQMLSIKGHSPTVHSQGDTQRGEGGTSRCPQENADLTHGVSYFSPLRDGGPAWEKGVLLDESWVGESSFLKHLQVRASDKSGSRKSKHSCLLWSLPLYAHLGSESLWTEVTFTLGVTLDVSPQR